MFLQVHKTLDDVSLGNGRAPLLSITCHSSSSSNCSQGKHLPASCTTGENHRVLAEHREEEQTFSSCAPGGEPLTSQRSGATSSHPTLQWESLFLTHSAELHFLSFSFFLTVTVKPANFLGITPVAFRENQMVQPEKTDFIQTADTMQRPNNYWFGKIPNLGNWSATNRPFHHR